MSSSSTHRYSVRWRPVSGAGLEHLTLAYDEHGARARSVVIGERGGRHYGVRYELACDAGWAVRRLDLATTDGVTVKLRSDGFGHWRDDGDAALPLFDGCIDVDLAGTPFTNTLPIRRLAWTEGKPVELAMLYIPFDSFAPTIDRQRYTCLRQARLFRYEAVDGSFEAQLPIDEDGLVLDYPSLFERIREES
jgi:hypothetical protein